MSLNYQPSPLWDDLNRQIGQLFLMGFEGTAVNDQIRSLIEDYHVGSILLTAQNLKSAEEATQLILDLQTIAHTAGHPVPLAIALEQDHGDISDLFDESCIGQFPGALGLAAAGSKKLAREVTKAVGQELNAIGVNWVLGPTLNVLTDVETPSLGVHAFGDDPQEASSYGTEFIKGYHEAGLATCGKLFPSSNNAKVSETESDAMLPTELLDPLSQRTILFQTAISHGIDAVLLGSFVTASDDANFMHASFSQRVVGNMLRAEMHFERVIVSACVGLEPSSDDGEIGRSITMAFQAGCDVIPLCGPPSDQQNAIIGLAAGVRDGTIQSSSIQQSLQRVLDLKSRWISWEKALNPPGLNYLLDMQASHLALSAAAYDKSITVVRNFNQLLPLPQVVGRDEEILLLTPLVKLPSRSVALQIPRAGFGSPTPEKGSTWDLGGPVMSGEAVFSTLGRAMSRQRHGRVLHTSYTAHGLRPRHEDLIARSHAVVVVTADAGRNLYQNGFAKHVSIICRSAPSPGGKHKEKPMMVVSVGSPYDFALDESIGTYVCTYDFTEAALHALVRVLYGQVSPSGRLPASTPVGHQLHHARPHWLVEHLDEERDLHHLETLLRSVRESPSASRQSVLTGVSPRSFLVRDPGIDEAHFVVRNSNTKEIYGFCSSYYFQSTDTGAIGSIIVDPRKRRLSIGQSLHSRAIRNLLQKKGIKRIQLGCRIPSIFLGLPSMDQTAFKELKSWFAKLGWDNASSQTVSNMILPNLPVWTAPDGLSHIVSKPDIKFDLQGFDHVDAILEHVVDSRPDTGIPEIYKMALADKGSCAIIRAKRPDDGSILGTLVLYKNEAKLAHFVPALADTKVLIGGISSPVISPAVEDAAQLMQGLILLGVRHLKKQGASAAVLDCVGSEHGTDGLRSMCFSIHHIFEVMSCPRSHWITAPPL